MRRAALLIAIGLGAGCGYGFAVGGAGLPEGVGALYVPVFENRSAEPEAGAFFAEALAERLARTGHAGGPGAPARVRGTVRSVEAYPLATGPDGRGVGLYRVEARVSLAIVRDGAVLCSRELRGSEEYLPARDLLGLEASRREALRRLAQRLMADAEHELCPAVGGAGA